MRLQYSTNKTDHSYAHLSICLFIMHIYQVFCVDEKEYVDARWDIYERYALMVLEL